MDNIKIGWGENKICPTGGKIYIAGSVPFRAVDNVHDDIKATAMVVQSKANRVIWVSCDFCHPTKQVEDRVIEILRERLLGFTPKELIISGTHSTACFYLSDTEILSVEHLLEKAEGILDIKEAREQVCKGIAEAVLEAVGNVEQEIIEYSSVDIITGLCRRTMYKDGSVKMYGSVKREDFLRMEYPDGGETKVLYFYEKDTRKLKGILAAVPCPAQADEASAHITADFWGYVRKSIKEHFGEDTKLLALCRAAGELSPHRLFDRNLCEKYHDCEMENLGKHISEQLIAYDKKTKLKLDMNMCELFHSNADISLPVRKITDEEYAWAKNYCQNASNYDEYGNAINWMENSNARHMVKFKENNIKTYTAKVSVVKLGKLIFFTAPAELYTEYAKRIIAKFGDIFDIQLTHDSIGYLPTKEAIEHGGYSTHHFSALCDENGGEVYVSKVCEMICEVIEREKVMN